MMIKRAILIVWLFFWLGSPVFSFDREETENINVYESMAPAIVAIDVQIPDGVSSGSGCIISTNGIILTSSHILENGEKILITTNNGQTFKGQILEKTPLNKDLALVKIVSNQKFIPVKFGDSSNLKVGQKVLAIGNPFGFNGTLTQGIISRIDYIKNKIQTDAAINPGSSGGPLLNTRGEVIGINQAIYNPDNNISNVGIGFAIPINTAKEFLSMMK